MLSVGQDNTSSSPPWHSDFTLSFLFRMLPSASVTEDGPKACFLSSSFLCLRQNLTMLACDAFLLPVSFTLHVAIIFIHSLFLYSIKKKSMIWFPLCCCDKITLVWSKATSGRKGCISASRSQSITGGNQKQELAGQTMEELPDHLKAGAYTAWTQMPREQCHTQDWALLHPSTIKTIFHRHTRRLNWSRNYPTWDSLLRRPGQWFSTFL